LGLDTTDLASKLQWTEQEWADYFTTLESQKLNETAV